MGFIGISCSSELDGVLRHFLYALIIDDTVQETQSDKLNEEEPMKGMVFDSAEAVFMFYESYAKRHGFAVRKRSHSKDTQGVKYVQLVCARACRGDSKSTEQSRIQDQHCDFTPHIASYTQLLNMVSMGCYTGHNYSINHHDYQGIENRALYGPNMCRSPFIRKLLEKDLSFKDEELLVVDYAFDGKHTKSEEDIVCLDDFKGREYFMTRYECATLEGTTWLIDEVINMYVRIKNINDATGERYFFLPYLTLRGQSVDTHPNVKESYPELEKAKKMFSTICSDACGGNIFDCKLLFFPLQMSDHWMVFVINLREYGVEVLDSYYSTMIAGLVEIINGVLIILEELSKSFGGKTFNAYMFTNKISMANVVKQSNTWDCGVMVIKFLDFWDGSMTQEINAEMTNIYRFQIAASMILGGHNKIKEKIIRQARTNWHQLK